MSGGKWDRKSQDCGLEESKKETKVEWKKKEKEEAAVDTDLTYEDFVTEAFRCIDDDKKFVNSAECLGHDEFDLTNFEAKPSTGKKGDKPYKWSYGYKGDSVPAWTTCAYKATMPHTKTGEVTDYKWKGGLLLSHTLPSDDIQAVV
jgi:hypothetical protein